MAIEETIDLPAIERKWSAQWREARAYEPEVREGQPKFFATYPYSYMNAFAHVGHAFTMGRVDFFTRYQRMRGRNTLYPFGFHVTGTPIVAAANRVRDGEAKQIQILEQQGIPATDIPQFAEPEHWVKFFPKEWRQDVERLGLGVDWRREFHTTELNPHYDAFIRWQFRKLQEGGYVRKGRHPVIWCPKDKAPVADHDRYEGEGETPQEWTLYKMQVKDTQRARIPAPGQEPVFLLAATLRPDTVFGQTNVWIDPAGDYVLLKNDQEYWVVNAESAKTFGFQWENARVEGAPFKGEILLGVNVLAPGVERHVPVLPAAFIKHEKGTGIVTSVPSDSPQDLLSLKAVQTGQIPVPEDVLHQALAIKIIPVIRTEKYGTESALRAVEEVGAKDHKDGSKIAQATELAYQAGFYEGVMLDNAQQFGGMPVAQAKEKLKEWLTARGEAFIHYWPSGPVVCRCLTPATVKIVSNQWFMAYGEDAWKKRTHEAIEHMQFYPPIVRKQFEYVVDWLRDWACAREAGLGTRLPWDERWLIESLSDSTIYMAYYTIAHLIEEGTVTGASGPRAGVHAKDLSDAFFDYVFLGKGTPEGAAFGSLTQARVEQCRREFTYWYPLDFRNSGKDLVQNHLTFMVFNHDAIWEDSRMWPQAISVNGWVTVDGEKMSKSRGNFITLRQALDAYGASGTRLALAYAGEGLDDANFDREFAQSAGRRLRQWLEFIAATEKGETGVLNAADRWFMSTMERLLDETRNHMDATNFRSAVKTGFFDLQREWAWYVRRRGGTYHQDVRARFMEIQNGILTPLVPHVAEEARRFIHPGKPGLAITDTYPEPRAEAISEKAELAERFVRNVLEDTREILKVTGITPKRIVYYTTPAWKSAMQQVAVSLATEGRLNTGALIKAAMDDPAVKAHAKEAPKAAGDLVKSLANLGPNELAQRATRIDEREALAESAAFLTQEFNGAQIDVHAADQPDLPDPAGKARHAAPGRPAIYVE